MDTVLENFHFLRPLWLLGLPLVGIAWLLARRPRPAPSRQVALVAPHLAGALTINSGARSRNLPVNLLAGIGLLAVLAGAGPTWQKVPSPWFAESAPLVIALEVSDSMRSNDMLPNRLDRARFKIGELMALRAGARTALVAYAGSAHIVMPPTTDAGVIEPFLEGLDPAIMPEPGAAAASVLPLVGDMIAGQGAATLLFVNDGFEAADVAALADYGATESAPALAALVMGTEQGGVALMPDGSPVIDSSGERLANGVDAGVLDDINAQTGMLVVRATTGDGDVNRLNRGIRSRVDQIEDPDARWQDQGWWLLLPALLLCAGWCRRGMAV